MASDHAEGWVQTQQKTFTKWANNHLRKKNFPALENIETEFEDGIKLMQLIAALYDAPMPKHNAAPKMRPHKLDNIELALKMMDDAKIKTNFLKPTHLIDHDLKMLLGMIWAIILDYAIKGIGEGDATAKEGLLLWCRKKTAGYRDVDPPSITNFSGNWKSGMAFCALIHRHQPQLIDYDSLDAKNAAANLELAFGVAERLGIPRLLDVDDLLTEKPDERSVMTQVAEYWRVFSVQDVKEVAARRAAKFVAFQRSLAALRSDYESRVRALLEWVSGVIARFESTEFGATLEDSLAVNERLRDYLLHEKPAKTAEKLDVESRFAELQTQLRVRDRAPYDPPHECAPATLDAAFDALWSAEKQHATAARERRFAFVHKTEEGVTADQAAEFEASYRHFDTDSDGQLNRDEFKAALAALSVPVKDDAALDQLMQQVSQGTGSINMDNWIRWNTERATDRDHPQQLLEAFAELANGNSAISADSLRVPPLTDDDVEFLTSAMPQAEHGGLDYAQFVQSSFRQ